MLKLFVITTDTGPSCFYKAETPEEAIAMYKDATLSDEISKPQCRLLTLELLMELAPDEFKLDNDTSF